MSYVDGLSDAARLRAGSLGEPGRAWLDRLDDVVSELLLRWSVRPGEALDGGSECLVLTALCSDGRQAVLKVGMPGAELGQEAIIYRLAGGRGYAELFAAAESHNALLLERLGAPLESLNLPVRQRIEVICETLDAAWLLPLTERPQGLMTGAEKALWLIDFIVTMWDKHDAPCAAATRDLALAYAEQRGAADATADHVLVHGDAHSSNALLVPGDASALRCKFVDPDGLFAERACDLAVPMRGWSAELLAGDAVRLGEARCRLLATLTGADEQAIWQWGFIERVSTGLAEIEIGQVDSGRERLAVADLWMRA